MEHNNKRHEMAAYGGDGWDPRTASLQKDIGNLWASCGADSEWAPLSAVLLHRPQEELSASATPDAVQMMARLDPLQAAAAHDALAAAYRSLGVQVHHVDPDPPVAPNQMFVADLMFMTPGGAIVARPASVVRAGEERWVARRLAQIGIPILRTVGGRGTFEGADAMWIDPRTVILGRGLRTNAEGVGQVSQTLGEMGIDTILVDLPYGTMHLMGMLRLVDHDLALAWPERLAVAAVEALEARGCRVRFIPDESEAAVGFALNFVTLGPREILMPAGNPITQAFYESLGIICHPVAIAELIKAAGAVGCLTGVLRRAPVATLKAK